MTPHELYVNRLISILDQKEPFVAAEFKNLTVKQQMRYFFLNKRSDKGLRLTESGFSLFSRYFEHFIINFKEKYFITGRHKIFLDRYCRYPYHYTNERIVLFDRDESFQFKLVDADIDLLMQMNPDVYDKR